MRYAIVRDGIVENVIVWDGETPYSPPEGTILVANENVGIGWSYDSATGEFIRPADNSVEGFVE